jgi:Tol biopolymer transport system component
MKLTTGAAIVGLMTVAAVGGSGQASAHPPAGAKLTGKIFYLREGNGGQRAFSIHAGGRSKHRLPNVKVETQVYVAPQAHLIVFTANVGEFTQQIAVANYAGRVLHRYSPAGLQAVVSVSPNGKYLGVESTDNTGRFVYKITTISGHTLGTLFSFRNSMPVVEESWNASSKDVAVLNATPTAHPKTTLKTYNRHGKVLRTLVKSAGPSYAVSWSRSGEIAYSTNQHINVVSHTGGKPRVLLTNSRLPDNGLSYSPNGAYLAYGLEAGENGQIWRVNADGTNPHLITGNGTVPAWG